MKFKSINEVVNLPLQQEMMYSDFHDIAKKLNTLSKNIKKSFAGKTPARIEQQSNLVSHFPEPLANLDRLIKLLIKTGKLKS